jgi:hypothetical protein
MSIDIFSTFGKKILAYFLYTLIILTQILHERSNTFGVFSEYVQIPTVQITILLQHAITICSRTLSVRQQFAIIILRVLV